MTRAAYSCLIGWILTLFLSGERILAQDVIIVSAPAGECELRVESNLKWEMLRLRAHHPQQKYCRITQNEMISILDQAFSKTDAPKLDRTYASLFLGRLIDYPWLSQHLATAAYHDPGWDSKRGKPVKMDINKFVGRLLFQKELISQIEGPLLKHGYRIVGVSVEKVLVGSFQEVPLYEGKLLPGKVPYDVQAWLRLKKE